MNSNWPMNNGMRQQYGMPTQMVNPFPTEGEVLATAAQAANVAVHCTNDTLNMIQQVSNQVNRTIVQLDRKRRRKQVNATIELANNGRYFLYKHYDDGNVDRVPLFVNVIGTYTVYDVIFERYSEDNGKYAVIEFPEAKRIIWCEKSKVFTGSNLYQCFLAAGVQFYETASPADIKQALQSMFISHIQSPRHTLCIDEMAGWSREGKWRSANQYSFPRMLSLPCARKKFSYVQNDKKQLEQFFTAFAEIKNLNYRIIMLEMLTYGVMSSILTQEGWTERYFLNFVLMEEIPEEWFCRLYQVFDRERCTVLSAAEKPSEIAKRVRELKDEVFILSMPKGNNNYQQKAAAALMTRTVCKLCGSDISSMGISWQVNAALVVLNHHISDSKRAINILTDTSVFPTAFVEMLKGNAVDSFLSSFVCYIEEHVQELKKTLRQYKEKSMSGLLAVLWKILKLFCSENEIDLYEMTKVEKEQNFYTVARELIEKPELDEVIVRAVKDSMKQVYVQEKCYGCKYMDDCCYWDTEYYFIPTKTFRKMMKANGILWSDVQMNLLKWKDAKLLLSDGEGCTYRLRLDEHSMETYRFKRGLFDKQLDIEMKDLGKEIM